MRRLETIPDATLERVARDPAVGTGNQRAAQAELARRAKLTNHCPRGKACGAWNCEKEH